MANTSYNTAPDWRTTYFNDQGVALIDGYLRFSKASDHSTRKAVYQSNIITPPDTTPPAYANPLQLAAGGNVGPIFYASDENYFVELWEGIPDVGTLVDSVDNWNAPDNTDPTPKATEVDFTNYIANADFSQIIRAKFETSQLPASPIPINTPRWFFDRSNTNGTNTVAFTRFIAGQTEVPDNPVRFLNYNCSAVGAAGETSKFVYYTTSNLNPEASESVFAFSGEEIVITFYAKSSLSNQLGVGVEQSFGAGGSSSVPTSFDTLTLTTDWTKYVVKGTVPTINGKTVGVGPSNEFLVRLDLPLNAISDIDITHFQLNRGTEELEYNYLTKNLTNGKVSGVKIPDPPIDFAVNDDSRTLISSVSGTYSWENIIPAGLVSSFAGPIARIPSGWLAANGVFHSRWEFPRLFTALERDYGHQFSLASFLLDVVTVTAKENGTVTDVDAGTSGFTVNVTQQGTGGLPEIFTVTTLAASAITAGSYLTFTLRDNGGTPTDFYIRMFIDNSGVDPALGGKTQIRLDLNGTDDAEIVANKLQEIFNPIQFRIPDYRGYFLRGVDHGALVDPDAGTRTDRGDGTTGDVVGTIQQDEFKSHTHVETTIGAAGPGILNPGSGMDNLSTPTGATGGAETRSKNIYVNYMIKY